MKSITANKSSQDYQDEILKKMSTSKKIKITSSLSMFCLQLSGLNHLTNGSHQPGKIIN